MAFPTSNRSEDILCTSLFVLSSFWFLQKLKRTENSSSQRRRLPRHQRFSVLYADRDKNKGKVGERGLSALAPGIPYLNQFLICLSNQCDPQRNPSGHIPLCVAENRLVIDMLAQRLMQLGTTTATFSDPAVYCYSSFLGMPVAREAAAYFLARRFLFPDDPDLAPDQALKHVNPNHCALGAGCAALLNNLFFLLGEPRDACLIPIPYYAAFENDMNLVAGVEPIGIVQQDPLVGPSVQELETAYHKAKADGFNPKFVLLTNPNNPLGIIYRRDVILRVIQWARSKGMHTIVDEIYALSTHRKRGHGFESVIKVLNNDMGNDVHMLWAVSKDFGGSGLRLGIVYSQNEIMMEGLANVSIFTCVSGPIQYLLAEVMTDDQFMETFLDEARNRILYSYRICTAKLEEMVIPYYPAEAGIFVYVDFSNLLPEKTFEWEEKLSNLMFEYARVVLTPGESQRETKPGMFRICYAWVSVEVLVIAMERLSRLVAKIRRMDWDDLNERSLAGIL